MEENLPQPQIPVNPVPPVQPPPPKSFPLKWIIIIALLAGIVLTGTFLIFKSQSAKQIPMLVPIQTSQPSPSPTCRPRPACLDAKPPCLMPETADMCPSSGGAFCGGIAGKVCPEGYKCQLSGSYPDAGGKCVKE